MSDKEPRWLSAEQQTVWRDWLSAVARINEQLDADLRPHNLDLNEYEVLVVLSESPDHQARMSQLAEASNQSRSRLTHTVGRMEAAGLIKRQTAADDRRGVVALLTTKGFDLLKTAAPDHVESVRRVLVDRIDPADWESLGRAMKAVLEGAESSR
ncbi:MarR family transcriptional regulator [Brooklawnia cerclae]|uniref:DNA-binding MarR family transcriptional regulator n=1 Tax=Brooklawnia cerclae TaxID=349934 RepID=A0ABX0SG95_9ACTN|nr:MarR family transcriptional regulator [Brooklawnia cerclae]NIH57354.1 DNA-binding MarR family transcriptional regulator [Brooklawnia cerclae]